MNIPGFVLQRMQQQQQQTQMIHMRMKVEATADTDVTVKEIKMDVEPQVNCNSFSIISFKKQYASYILTEHSRKVQHMAHVH